MVILWRRSSGAIFLDQGYARAEAFVHQRMVPLFMELEASLREQTTNYKSLLLEWTQKHHLTLDFRMLQEPKRSGAPFVCGVYVDERKVGVGSGPNKKGCPPGCCASCALGSLSG